MKLTKFAMVVTGLFILAATPAWANFLVNVKVSCSFVDDLNGQQKLGKTVLTKDELIQHFLDIAGSALPPSSVELTYDSDFRRFHLIDKANEVEVILIGTSQCIDATNQKGVTTKMDSTCILTIEESGSGGGISGTALGTEKSTDVFPAGGPEKFTFKASYKGHFITSDGNNICTIQFVTGQLF